MAYRLLGATNSVINYGDINAIAGLTEFSVAVTVRPVAAPVTDVRLVSQWGNSPDDTAFLLVVADTNEVAFAVRNNANTNLFGRKTTDVRMTAGTPYGIVATFVGGSPPTVRIFVNGVEKDTASFAGTGNVTALRSASSSVTIGLEPDTPTDGLDADYEHAALWRIALSPWAASRISAGAVTPSAYSTGGLLYAPLTTMQFLDVWRGTPGTPASAERVAPIRPLRSRRLYVDLGAAPGGISIPVVYHHRQRNFAA